jgi:hypothetical protein
MARTGPACSLLIARARSGSRLAFAREWRQCGLGRDASRYRGPDLSPRNAHNTGFCRPLCGVVFHSSPDRARSHPRICACRCCGAGGARDLRPHLKSSCTVRLLGRAAEQRLSQSNNLIRRRLSRHFPSSPDCHAIALRQPALRALLVGNVSCRYDHGLSVAPKRVPNEVP